MKQCLRSLRTQPIVIVYFLALMFLTKDEKQHNTQFQAEDIATENGCVGWLVGWLVS